MRNRDYKNFLPGSFYHVYNRGNNRDFVFRDEEDFRAFLFRVGLGLGFDVKELSENPLTSVPFSRIRITDSKQESFKLHAFCLMPNHFHFMIEQCSDIPISKFILKICTSYAMYANKKYSRVGNIFQDCFKSVLINSNEQFMWTPAYIHMNPVKDGLAKHPSNYKWSSYSDYLNDRKLPITHTDFLLGTFGSKENMEKQTCAVDMSRVALDS